MVKFLKFLLLLVVISFSFFLGVRFSDFFNKTETSVILVEEMNSGNMDLNGTNNNSMDMPVGYTDSVEPMDNVEIDVLVPVEEIIYPTNDDMIIIEQDTMTDPMQPTPVEDINNPNGQVVPVVPSTPTAPVAPKTNNGTVAPAVNNTRTNTNTAAQPKTNGTRSNTTR